MASRILSALLLFCFLTAFTSSVFAAVPKPKWLSRWDNTFHSSPQAACDSHGSKSTYDGCYNVTNEGAYGWYYRVWADSKRTEWPIFYAYPTFGNCPNSTTLVDPSGPSDSGSCACPIGKVWDDATQNCIVKDLCGPKKDQKFTQTIMKKLPPIGTSFPPSMTNEELFPGFSFENIDSDGCISYSSGTTSCSSYTTNSSGGFGPGCNFEYVYTGTQSQSPVTPTPPPVTISSTPDLIKVKPPAVTTAGPPVVDGNTTTQTTTTITPTTNTTIFDNSSTTITITESSGGNSTTTTTTTTVTDPVTGITSTTITGTTTHTPTVITTTMPKVPPITPTINITPSISMPSTTSTTTTNTSPNGTTTSTTTGGGTGTGSGDGDCVGDQCGNSDFGPYDGRGPGDLYSPDESRTYTSVLRGFVDRVSASPIFSAVTSFFKVDVSGTCPVWSINNAYIGTITFDQHCSLTMTQIWPYIKAIVLLAASFLAFRIAFGD